MRQGRRPGDVRVRIARTKPEAFTVKAPDRRRAPVSAPVLLITAFVIAIATGTVLLMLPFSTADGSMASFIDALFTATSAVCVTGLVVVHTGTYWSGFGHLVILLLIQVGGFGIMAGSTLLLLLVARRGARLRERLLVQEAVGTDAMGNAGDLIRRIARFTIAVELIGAAVLTAAFLLRGAGGDPLGSLWWGVFHSVSAFNNAGFDLTPPDPGMVAFADDWVILPTFGVLLLLGGLGYVVVADVVRRRRWVRLTLESKIVLLTSAALVVGGAILTGAIEWHNPDTLGSLPESARPLNAVFHAASVRTAGFAILPTDAFLEPTLVLGMALMFIGGASGSTAGGIKVNTFGLLLIAIASTVRGEPSAVAFGRRVRHELVYRALAVALLYLAFFFVAGFLLRLTTDVDFLHVVFEAMSALGTVGASAGFTADTDVAARLVLVATMFAGRLGPLTLVLALAARAHKVSYRPAIENIRIG